MNLSALSLGELTDLQSALALIHKGVSILSGLPVNQAEAETSIDLTPGEVVTITTHFRMPGHFRAFGPPPDFVLIDNDLSESPAPVSPAPVFARRGSDNECATGSVAPEAPGGSGDLQQRTNVESPPEAGGPRHKPAPREGAPVAAPEAGESPAPAGAAGDAGGGEGTAASVAPLEAKPAPILGPMSAEEKAEVRRLAGGGMAVHDIAARLNRRVQSVASVLAAGKAKGPDMQEIPAGQPAPEAPARATGKAGSVPAGAGPDAGGPEAATAAPDMGHAPAAAPEAGGAAPLPPVPLTARQREIVDHLRRLGASGGIDVDLDLEIAEGFAGGIKAAQLALDLDLDCAAMTRRYRQLTLPIRDERDRMSIEGQADLLLVLRHRVAEARAKGAA